MNPQPPVTRMRMAARTSSADKSAPAESSAAFAGVRRYLEHWQDALAGTDWVPWAILGVAVFLRFLLLGLWKFGRLNYLWCAGMGLAGMILTKETYAIHLACAILAIPTLAVSYAVSRVPDAKPAKQTWTWIDLAMVLGVGAAAIIFFYSGTFFNWNGVRGLYQAFKAWTETGAAGHGHEKAWDYWLKLMGPTWEIRRSDFLGYELPMLAGLILCLFCQKFKNLSLRYLAIYGVGTLVAYSYVKYKTPWCVISFGWPLLFIFGGAVLLVRPKHLRIAHRTIGVLLCISLGSDRKSTRLNSS